MNNRKYFTLLRFLVQHGSPAPLAVLLDFQLLALFFLVYRRSVVTSFARGTNQPDYVGHQPRLPFLAFNCIEFNVGESVYHKLFDIMLL